ncbi:MAG: CehA/McbA family metallohydrolase [Gemmatimonadota bacterium]
MSLNIPGPIGRSLVAALALTLAAATALDAQWTNRYPRWGSGHHVYVEGFEFPSLDAGVLDPAPSPDGRSIAFSSRGWIWVLDLASGVARRVTRGAAAIDSRPAWSPDGASIAFVRDDTRRTWVVVADAATGRELSTVENGPVVLDPAFSRDGSRLFYSSSGQGDLDIWSRDLATGADTRVIGQPRLQLRPQPHPDGERLVYLLKAGEDDEVRVRNADGSEVTLLSGGLLSQTRPALSPNGRFVVAQRPTHDGTWELVLVELARPSLPVVLTHDHTPQTPAWSADGEWIWFVESDAGRNLRLRRIAFGGGPIRDVAITRWDYGEPMGTVRVRTRIAGTEVAARLNAADAVGHPAVPEPGQVWFDGQHGRVFFYSPGDIELVVPAGAVTVTAVRGLTTPAVTATTTVAAGGTQELVIDLEPVWDAQANGWYSGDHHFHLNYGGQHALAPDDLVPMMRGEDLDVGTPLLASLNNRFEDQHLWGWSRDEPPIIRFAQEIRPHFHGHTSLIGIDSLFWPWVWGPGNPIYNAEDISNSDALRHARADGGMASYVHPVFRPDPFGDDGLGSIPLELIPDAVLGDLDAIDVACLWTSELGTAEVWYRLLNVGAAIVPSAGTDVMTNFFRTMAVGTTRVYARPDGPFTFDSYLAALKAGRSFVTTGPMIEFAVGDVGPGGVVDAGSASWSLDVHTPVPFARVEVLVNGSVAWSGEGMAAPGSRTYSGTVDLPAGGWVAVRTYSETGAEWPVMNTIPFAHTAPVWIGSVGSTEPAAARAAAADLLRALDNAEERLQRYGDADIPRIRERFERARVRLVGIAG